MIDSIFRRVVHGRLAKLRDGALSITDALGTRVFGSPTARCALHAHLTVDDPSFYTDLALGGSVGAGESYIGGRWRADDLTTLARILIVNRDVLDGMERGFARATAPLRTALHWMARNTRRGSRRNIAAHYDLGNAFFGLFLDPTMMYSSAVFDAPRMTLEQGSIAKLDRICRKLDLAPTDHVVEIGTGWGGFAIHAAARYGCRVTTTTISREQHALASERIAAAGLSDRVTVLLEDYRALRGRYDKLVSIEMIEAVGHHYYDDYFRKCSELLAPAGAMCLQAITIADQRYLAARDSVDFIKRYVFPGCCIPSVSVIADAIARVTDMRMVDLEDIGADYAATLAQWRLNLERNADAVRGLGYPDAFIRLWTFYLTYCEAGFAERALGDVQVVLAKPDARLKRSQLRAHALPASKSAVRP